MIEIDHLVSPSYRRVISDRGYTGIVNDGISTTSVRNEAHVTQLLTTICSACYSGKEYRRHGGN